ncbi:MAG TPA: neutral/alkaline non-lysosomal ceramidase N-terminal domain-containing protein [Anaeromyxobacteraceae bacterium]|nr:neutral/alkaline non-lysosomal ceramidase N-terminal domain-containing protein [Anaeromyxobacteraceae bacterium]
MRKLLATGAALILLAGAAIAVGSLAWRPTARSGPARITLVAAGTGQLEAGVASVALQPLPGTPIAGFPRLDWHSEGEREPVMVRALYLGEPGARVAIASVEVLLVTSELTREVKARLRDLELDHLILAATHTHAGPGGWWRDPLAQRVALGPYDHARLEHLAERVAQAVRDAVGARQPAALAIGQTQAARLVRNRAGGEVDARLVSLRIIGQSGEDLARVVVFPSHPTMLGSRNVKLSGDWPGALASSSRTPLLFFQGASGDQSTRTPKGRERDPEAYAKRVAAELATIRHGEPDATPQLAVAIARAVLPPPALGASPPLFRRVTRNLLYDLFPDRAEVTALRLGELTLIAVPAEPVASIGQHWRDRIGAGTEIVSLAGDYLGYVETPEQMERAAGETPRTYFGPELEQRLEAAVVLAATEAKRAALKAEERESGAHASGDAAASAGAIGPAEPHPAATP